MHTHTHTHTCTYAHHTHKHTRNNNNNNNNTEQRTTKEMNQKKSDSLTVQKIHAVFLFQLSFGGSTGVALDKLGHVVAHHRLH